MPHTHPANPPAETPAPRLRLLGAPALVLHVGSALPLAAQDAALLALLALNGAMPRTEAVALLWPDAPPARARTNLRQRLYRLRRDAGRDVVAGRERLELALAHDLAPVSALAKALAADPGFAVAPLLGLTLARASLARSPEVGSAARAQLDESLAAAHALWQSRLQQALLAAAEEREAAGQPEAALALLRRAAGAEPLNEDLQRRLMQLLYRQGARAAALAEHERLRQALKRELNLAPQRETQDLAELIRRDAPPRVARQASLAGAVVADTPSPVEATPAPAGVDGGTPAACFAAGVLAASLRRPPRLVQRDDAWRRLESAWRERRIALVLGEAGIGKSRLLQDFAREHPGIVAASARPGDAAVPYTVLARLVAAAWPAEAGGILDADDRSAGLQPWVRAELARIAPALGTPTPGPLGELRLVQAMTELLRTCGGVLLDDLHFADAASLELLPALLAEPLPWLLALRPQEARGVLAKWLQAEDVTRRDTLELGPLDAAGVQELMAVLALPGMGAPAWAHALLRHTGGRPLFLLEVLRALLRQGAPAAVPERLPLPGEMRQLLAHRVQQLAEAPRMALQAVALLGNGHGLTMAARESVLGAVLEMQPLVLAVTMGQLEQDGLLVRGEFAHDMLFETVAEGVPDVLARLLHRRIAEQLRARADAEPGAGRAPGLAARLAAHWAAAGCEAEAAAAHERAAAEAWASSRRREEIEHRAAAVRCWEAAGEASRAFEARFALSLVMVLTGRLDDAQVLADSLRAAATTPRQHAAAGVAECNVACTAGAWGDALAAGEPAFVQAAALDEADLAAACAPPLAVALSQSGRGEDALSVLDRADAFARRLGEPRLLLDVLSYRGHVLDRLGRVEQAADATGQALALAESLPDWTEAFTLAGNLAILRARQARLVQADVEAARSCAIAARLGITQGMHLASARLSAAVFAAMLGRLGEGVAGVEASIELFRQADAAAFVPAAENHLAWLWMVLGQPARARRILWDLPAGLPPVTRARRLALRGRLARFCGMDPGPAAEWQAGIEDETLEPSARIANALERLLTLPPPLAAARAEALEGECETMGLASGALQARIRRLQAVTTIAGTAGGRSASEPCLSLALSLRDELRERQPNDFWRPEAALVLAAAFDAAGEPAMATSALREADAWLRDAVLPHVPAHFLAGFRQRNLMHSRLARALAARG